MGLGVFTVYIRDMRRFVRFKHQLLSSFLQPVLWLGFFGVAMAGTFDRILGSSTPLPGIVQVSYLTFMAPGIIGATVLFTTIYGGFSLLFDRNWGILREVMASPMPRRDLILGLASAGVTKAWIQSVMIVIFGLVLGVSFFQGMDLFCILAGFSGFLVFVAAFSVTFLCISVTLALKIDSVEGFQGVATLLTMPLFFLSNSLYPMEGLPPGIQQIALLNPLTHLTTGIRYCLIGDHFTAIGMEFMYPTGEVLLSLVHLVILAVVMFVIALKTVETVQIT